MGTETLSEALIGAVNTVTKKWAKVRKAEERQQERAFRRRAALIRPSRVTIKEVAWEVMEAAYLKASAQGKLPAHARQVMYAARGPIQAETGQCLNDQYFCQTLLPDYLRENPEATARWDIVFDARGHFAEPHTARIVPLGTLGVRQYLSAVETHTVTSPDLDIARTITFPTCGPSHRFGAVLFVEKEGFLPLFEHVHLAERFDLAIMSTKGLSVTASRRLVDVLCGKRGIPLLVLHDFDKAGFSICATLQRDTRRYEFTNTITAIDVGLRLADVQAEHLEAEDVSYGKADPRANLRENGASQEEIQFLCSTRGMHGYAGQRVELNAFSSDRLIAWLEARLKQHGVDKVIPDPDTLDEAYRRALKRTLLQERVEELLEDVDETVQTMKTPKTLSRILHQRLKATPTHSWDQAIAELAAEAISDGEATD